MSEIVKLSVTLGALGVRRALDDPHTTEILKFGLSFIMPEVMADSLLTVLGASEEEVLKRIAEVGKKVDLLLSEAQSSSVQLLRDAFIAYEHKNYKGACQLFNEVRQNAFKAFNYSRTVEALVLTTQLKITALYMFSSYREDKGDMAVFSELDPHKQKEIALTMRGYIDDMFAKVAEEKRDLMVKARKKVGGSKKQVEKAKLRVHEIDAQVDKVLSKAYPLLTQGLGLTDPVCRVLPGADSLTFRVLPQYVPVGLTESETGDHESMIMVASEPEIVVTLDKKALDPNDPKVYVLNWVVKSSQVKHQQLFNNEESKALDLVINSQELGVIFRSGGGGSNTKEIENNADKMRRMTIANGAFTSPAPEPDFLAPHAPAVGRGDEDEERARRASTQPVGASDFKALMEKGNRQSLPESGVVAAAKAALAMKMPEIPESNLPDGTTMATTPVNPAPAPPPAEPSVPIVVSHPPPTEPATLNSEIETAPPPQSAPVVEAPTTQPPASSPPAASPPMERQVSVAISPTVTTSPPPSEAPHMETCCKCGLLISGAQIHALERFYHPDCFKCFVCAQPLKTKFRVRNGEVYCQEDYEEEKRKAKAMKRQATADVVESTPAVVELPPEPSPPPSPPPPARETCRTCGLPIMGGQVHALGEFYHPGCFKCVKCGTILQTKFRSRNGEPYCQEDYEAEKKRAKKGSLLDSDQNGVDDVQLRAKSPVSVTVTRTIAPANTEPSAPAVEEDPGLERCCMCNLSISGAQVHAMDKFFHPDCFRCARCDRVLTTSFKSKDGVAFCEEDFEREKQEEKAAKKAGKRTSVKVGRSLSNRMKCDECGDDIAGTYFQHEGKNVCEKDYEKKYRKKCGVCGENISGSYYTDPSGDIICQKDYKARQGGSLACQVCGDEVSTGEIVRAADRLFHPRCFNCCVCSKNLATEPGFNSDEQKNVYCKDDYTHGCKQPIAPKEGEKSASRLRAFDKDWHPECFKCDGCKTLLGGNTGKSCYPMDDVPLCLDCHKERL